MEWWHVYLFTRLDNLSVLICIVLIALMITVLISGITWGVNADMAGCGDKYDNIISASKKLFKRCLSIAGAVALIAVLVPSQKEVAAIYLLPKLAHSDFAKESEKIPTDMAKLMRLKLESWVADMEVDKVAKKP